MECNWKLMWPTGHNLGFRWFPGIRNSGASPKLLKGHHGAGQTICMISYSGDSARIIVIRTHRKMHISAELSLAWDELNYSSCWVLLLQNSSLTRVSDRHCSALFSSVWGYERFNVSTPPNHRASCRPLCDIRPRAGLSPNWAWCCGTNRAVGLL